MDPTEQSPSTRSHGAYLRAAMELEDWVEAWAGHDDVPSFVVQALHSRANDLRRMATEALEDIVRRGVPLRRRDDDYTPEAIDRTLREE